MSKLNFQQPLLQSLESHDPPEIILICLFSAQVTFIMMMLKTVMLLNIYMDTVIHFFKILKWIEHLK